MTSITKLPTGNFSVALAPNTGTNYAAVDDVVIDTNATYVAGADGVWKTDLYYAPVPFSRGTINSIRIYIYCYGSGGKAKTAMYRVGNATTYYGSEINLADSWSSHYTEYLYHPGTSNPWVFGEVVYPGVSLYGAAAKCTAVWVAYNITPSAGAVTDQRYTNLYCFHLYDGQTLQHDYTMIRSLYNPGPMVIGASGSTITGSGVFDGNFASSASNLIELTGTCTVQGTSSVQPLTIKNNLYHGIEVDTPTNCLLKWLNVEDCRSGTSSVPVTGDSSLGVGAWLYGAGSGNTISYCNFKRCGMHAIQLYGNDENTIDHCTIDGVYGYFGISLYQSDGDTVTSCTTKNTRREGINAMECADTTLNYPAVYDTQTDYGICIYLSNGTNVILEPTIYRAYKNGISLEGANNTTITGGELVDCGRGAYVGWKSGILLLGSGGYNCSGNVIDGTRIIDKNHYLRNGIMETDASNCLSNTVRDVVIYGVRAAKVRFCATSGSVEE